MPRYLDDRFNASAAFLRVRRQPRYRRMAHAIAPTNISQGLTISSTRQRLLDLKRGELGASTKPTSTSLSPSSTISSPGQDHRSLELSQGSEHSKDQLPMWASRVDQRISKRSEPCLTF